MALEANKRQWDDLGQIDPLWAMTGTHKFGAWDLEAFLQTGDRQVAQVMREARQLGRPHRQGAVLDFGCGVGRMARGFRAHFDHYVGLDISDSLIAKARELHAQHSNLTFAVSVSEALSSPDEQFDLVYCWGVFQHIPERSLALRLVGELVRVLRRGGLLVFNAVHHVKLLYRLQPRRRLYALLRRAGMNKHVLYNRLKLYPQGVYVLPYSMAVAHMQAARAEMLDVRSYASPNGEHQFSAYYVTK